MKCKITREKWSHRIVNKGEEKEYHVLFEERIVLDKGQESIPYGFHWNPSTTSMISHTVTPPDPDNLLYTFICPSDAVGEKSTEMD